MSILREMLKEYNKAEDGVDRWKLWENNRETIKELEEKNIFSEDKDIENAIILGAGSCDDIDLKYLCSKVEKLTLADIDLESMKTGVEKQNLSKDDYEKIEFIGNIDFTGLEDTNFYKKLEESLKKKEKPKKILKIIMKSLEAIKDEDLLGEDSYSLVISGAVHSQLTSVAVGLLNKYSDNYRKKDFNKIHKDLIYLDDKISLKYNDLIMSLAKEDAIVFSWFDLNEFSESLGNFDQAEKVDEYCKEGNSEKVIELVTKNRLVGFHGYLDLNKRALEKELKVQPWVNFWVWEFTCKKSYLVFSITIDLSKE